MLQSCRTSASKLGPSFFVSLYLVQADVRHVGEIGEVRHSWHAASTSHAFEPQTGVVRDHLCEEVEDRLFFEALLSKILSQHTTPTAG